MPVLLAICEQPLAYVFTTPLVVYDTAELVVILPVIVPPAVGNHGGLAT